MTTLEQHRDDHRKRMSAALLEMAPYRQKLQVAYGEMMGAMRHAAQCARHYAGRIDPDPRRDRYAERIAHEDACAAEAYENWREIDRDYHREGGLRDRALVRHGCDEEIALSITPEENERWEKRRHEKLLCPPIGWGSSIQNYDERCSRWQSRPERERLATLGPRETL